MYRILVLALDGVVDSSLALTLDTVATANRIAASRGQGPLLESTLFQPGRKRIRTGMGARYSVVPAVRIHRYDAVVVPGLGLATPGEVSRFVAKRTNRAAIDWLEKTGTRAPIVGASCSAVFILAEAGLLTGHTITTSWWLGAHFRERYPDVEVDESRMTVESKGILTAGAALAQIDLMLHLISKAIGPAMSRDVARYLAVDQRPSQSRYMMLSAVAGLTEDLVEIDRWIRRRLSKPVSIDQMAKALGLSPRTLDRRIRAATGAGPNRFIQQIRLERATHLIETSDLPLSDIASEVGYKDVSTLRRLIQRRLGTSPTDLRKRAGLAR